MMKKLVIFSGAGMSQESGLPTFRGKDGLWKSMDVEKVADRKAWYCGRRPDCRERRQAVLDFINPIRRRVLECRPNEAHLIAGSTRVIHLHGEALKNASTLRPYIPIDIDSSDPDIRIGDKAPDGSQTRPYVIFFNENLQYGIWKEAVKAVREADMMVIATETADNIGTCIIDFTIHSSDELRFVIKRVKEIEGVDEVTVQQRL